MKVERKEGPKIGTYYADDVCVRQLTIVQNLPQGTARSSTGRLGVYRSGGKYLAQIKHNGKTINLGRTSDLNEAIRLREKAEQELFGHLLDDYSDIKKEIRKDTYKRTFPMRSELNKRNNAARPLKWIRKDTYVFEIRKDRADGSEYVKYVTMIPKQPKKNFNTLEEAIAYRNEQCPDLLKKETHKTQYPGVYKHFSTRYNKDFYIVCAQIHGKWTYVGRTDDIEIARVMHDRALGKITPEIEAVHQLAKEKVQEMLAPVKPESKIKTFFKKLFRKK